MSWMFNKSGTCRRPHPSSRAPACGRPSELQRLEKLQAQWVQVRVSAGMQNTCQIWLWVKTGEPWLTTTLVTGSSGWRKQPTFISPSQTPVERAIHRTPTKLVGGWPTKGDAETCISRRQIGRCRPRGSSVSTRGGGFRYVQPELTDKKVWTEVTNQY